MTDPISYTSIIGAAGGITAIGTAWLTIRKISKDAEKQKKIQSAAILQAAKEADKAVHAELVNKIHDLSVELKVLKETTEKELAHHKETYNSEIRFLGQKIEELRGEVRNQHSQLVQLLSKMIEKD